MALTKNEFLAANNAKLSNLNGVDPRTLKPVNLSLTSDQINAVYSTLLSVVSEELEKAGELTLPGLVEFKVAEVAERTGRNPLTGEALTIPARKVVRLRPVKGLRTAAASAALPPAKPAKPLSEAQLANNERLRSLCQVRRAA